jgi:pimeloyl-ACP methyl ester carboxylesterase
VKQDDRSPASRRAFIAASAAALVTSSLRSPEARAQPSVPSAAFAEVAGTEHWTVKRAGADNVKLFMWRKRLTNPSAAPVGGNVRRGTILFVHGSSVSATPVFDLRIPGKPEASTMDWFARLGYDTWCVDCEGYGYSDKSRSVNADVSCGADDLAAASEYIMKQNGGLPLLLYGASSGALRAGLFAQRHPERVQRIALDALVWTGEGSPTLAERRKRLAQYQANNRRPIDRAFVQSIFTRDHPGTSDLTVVDAFADAVLALDTSMPTGTYIDMSANLPVLDPNKITVPTLIMRGQYDGIASFQDLANFFALLPNPDKQFIIMPGIAHTSTRSKNWALVYHLLDANFSQPAPVYVG